MLFTKYFQLENVYFTIEIPISHFLLSYVFTPSNGVFIAFTENTCVLTLPWN